MSKTLECCGKAGRPGLLGGTLFDVLDMARGQGDADPVDLDGRLGLFGVFLGSFSDCYVSGLLWRLGIP